MVILWILLSAICWKTSSGQQIYQPHRRLTVTELQQCSADMGCSINFANIFQTKLDNASHYMELELALLRHQTTNAMQPLTARLQNLETNYTVQMAAVTSTLERAVEEVVYDRQYMGNLTRGLYILNEEFHKENMIRYQDVHSLVLELNIAKKNLTSLQTAVNLLLSRNYSSGTNQGGSSGSGACPEKDEEISSLQRNLTYYVNAYSSSKNALELGHAMETDLQTQIVHLKENISRADAASLSKDHLIVSLTNQLSLLQSSSQDSHPIGTCVNELGMKNGRIPADHITASASQSGHEARFARLDDSQGWLTPERNSSNDYLQIDTGSPHFITKVATQGAPCCGVMVKIYTLQYSDDGTTWNDYKIDCALQYFTGNVDAHSTVSHTIDPPIHARFIRFNVVTFKKDAGTNYVGMRVELYGCTR